MWYLIIILTVAQKPLVYVIPVECIPGNLSLVQAGDTGTIPMETRARSQAEIEDLRDKYSPKIIIYSPKYRRKYYISSDVIL